MSVTIVPAILTNDPNKYKAYVNVVNEFTKRVHIDVADGQFVPSSTLPDGALWWPKDWTVDLHLMAAKPSEHIAQIIKLHPSLCVIHAESGEDIMPVLAQLKQNDIKAGVSIIAQTFPGDFKDAISIADHVLIFAGALGQQGGIADLFLIEKVKLIREISPSVEIGWDGGANLSNVRMLAHADIDVINVGSAISTAPDPAAAYAELVAEADRRNIAIEHL